MSTQGYVLPTRGVVLGNDTPRDQAAHANASVVDLAQTAETLGFDSVWAGDSVLAKPRLQPLATLATVAGCTNAIDLGTAIALPHIRHPVHVAHQAATVDLLSGGRFKMGVGVGSGDAVEREHEQFGVPYEKRGRVLDETLNVLETLWTGACDSYDGEFVSLDNADIGLRPPGDLPIYVASATFDPRRGFPKPIRRRIVEHGAGWLPISKSPEMYEAGLTRARDLLEVRGRNPDAFVGAYYQDVVIAETESEALEQAREFLADYYPEWGRLSDEQLRRRGAFGPPAVVADHLEIYTNAGVETFVTRFPTDDQHDQLRRFERLQ